MVKEIDSMDNGSQRVVNNKIVRQRGRKILMAGFHVRRHGAVRRGEEVSSVHCMSIVKWYAQDNQSLIE